MFFLYRHHARFMQKIVVTFFSCTGLVNFPLLAAPPSQQISSFHTESCECSVYPSRTNIMHLPPILPPLICNGGDGRDSAYPVGRTDIEGLSAGDTVARYRRDEDSDLNDINAARSSRIAHKLRMHLRTSLWKCPKRDTAPRGISPSGTCWSF